jgi:hypothetical protein
MKSALLLLLLSSPLFAQYVQLRGKVYDSKSPYAPIPGVTVTLAVPGGTQLEKLTGQDGMYRFVNVTKTRIQMTFVKATWQPDPRKETIDLSQRKDAPFDVDLFQPTGDQTLMLIAQHKAQRVQLEVDNGANPAEAFTNEWQSCSGAAIPVRQRVACAQVLNSEVPLEWARPTDLSSWAKVRPEGVKQLESSFSFTTLRAKQPEDYQAIVNTGVPAQIVFAQVQYEANHADASDSEKAKIKTDAASALKYSPIIEDLNVRPGVTAKAKKK